NGRPAPAPPRKHAGDDSEAAQNSFVRTGHGGATVAGRAGAGQRGGHAYRRHHSYMMMAAAAEALIERVEPYWVISMCPEAAASASSLRPGPSWPNSSTQRSGSSARSTGTASPTLSTAMTGMPSARAQSAKE